jgi:hypothetical protein
MARTRYLKPDFFANEQLADLDPLTRLLFAGLWCYADREGRLEDRPRRIQVAILPYDSGANVDDMLGLLAESKFIVRYAVEGVGYIQIVNFSRHQHPHPNEPPSNYPPPKGNSKTSDIVISASDNVTRASDNVIASKALKSYSYSYSDHDFNRERPTSLSLSRPAKLRAAPDARRERESISQFSLRECREYAESLPQITAPGGFAKTIWRSGEEDEQIAAWKDSGGGKESEDDRRNRLRRLRQDQRNH